MKDTPQDPHSFDDAFDARCRDVLSQRSVPAPPFVPPATPAMGTGKKVILAAGAVALLAQAASCGPPMNPLGVGSGFHRGGEFGPGRDDPREPDRRGPDRRRDTRRPGTAA